MLKITSVMHRTPVAASNPGGPNFVVTHTANDRRVYHGASRFAGTLAQLDTYLSDADDKAREPQTLTYNVSVALDVWPQSMIEHAQQQTLGAPQRDLPLAQPAAWTGMRNALVASLSDASGQQATDTQAARLCAAQLQESLGGMTGIVGRQAAAEFASCQANLTSAMHTCESAQRESAQRLRSEKLHLVRSTLDVLKTLRSQHAMRAHELEQQWQHKQLHTPMGSTNGDWKARYDRLLQLAMHTLVQRVVPVLNDPFKLRTALGTRKLEVIVGALLQIYTAPLHHIQLLPTLNDAQLIAAETPTIESLLVSVLGTPFVAHLHPQALAAATEACVRLQKLSEQIDANEHTMKAVFDAEHQRALEQARQRFTSLVNEACATALTQLSALTSASPAANKAVDEWIEAWTRLRQSHAATAAGLLGDLQEWFAAALKLHKTQLAFDAQQQQLEFVSAIINFAP